MPGGCHSYKVRSEGKMESSGFPELKSRFWCSGQTTGRRGCCEGREFRRAGKGCPQTPEYRSAHARTEIILDDETATKRE